MFFLFLQARLQFSKEILSYHSPVTVKDMFNMPFTGPSGLRCCVPAVIRMAPIHKKRSSIRYLSHLYTFQPL